MIKAAILSFSFIILASYEASAVRCVQAFNPNSIRDNYRAYAIGKEDSRGVTRIHAVDLTGSALTVNMYPSTLKEIILKREQFNNPETALRDLDSSFEFYIPIIPMPTVAEYTGANARRIHRELTRDLERLGDLSRSRNQKPPKTFEYRTDDSHQLLFLVELKTQKGHIEIVFTKHVNTATMDYQAAAYAIHIARQLGYQTEGVWDIKMYGGGFQ